ncbi:hypothetical protein TrVE_jg12807 [Triparma verrucosa]|uniref:Thioredoxin domain-containing protein n=2 Tax=Triparma TaxID=722752 RepID=A0A9W7BS32_9STRA|nr:hypothetical protein TrST_g14205 [Triparma strigata]GMI05776.1 hypothetical protein TrVE_jg12807 [Triparma verrucosa]|mmetsp:Transcript_7509/g.13569  ORF Transcript_7509/g.13569 Transcript_7509/m.13569 type:complete len:156 (-) Transcript_7509:73-540(-)
MPSLLNLPLTDLHTAEDTDISTIASNSTGIIIDFWTTKCTRCPAALDKLHALSLDPLYAKYTFLSIVCDALDPARDILHADKDVKWPNIRHLFTPVESKELAKAHYGFNQVPFYVVYEDGEVKQASNKVDFEALVKPAYEEEKKEEREFCMDEDF